jgi:DNA-binding CsgD family transcriptional regulator
MNSIKLLFNPCISWLNVNTEMKKMWPQICSRLRLLNVKLPTSYTENWKRLSEREQTVTALICMQYTNQQIAERLSISPHTVKSHVRNISHKFGLTTKADLRQALANWDFSAWDH